MAGGCPGCDNRDLEINRQKEKLQEERERWGKTEAGYGSQVEALTRSLEAERKEMAERLARVDFPGLTAVIAHCEGGQCPSHAQQWEEVKAKIVQKAIPLLPKEIIRKRGLELGLIPKEILLKGL